MPELPDIEVFAHNLKSLFLGKRVVKVNVVNGNKLKDHHHELSEHLEGHKLTDIYRSGKEFRLVFSNGVVLGMHLMLTGDIFVFEKVNESKFTIIEFYYEDGTGLALTDRMRNANVKLHPEDKEGIDALSDELNYKNLKTLLNRKTKIKDILLDQHIIRGIGNGYSDEILWECRISPNSIASAIPDNKIKELAKTIKTVMTDATEKILKAYPGLINGEVKEFLKIHRQKTSPTGLDIIVEKKGARKTYYTKEQVLYK